MPLAAKPIAVKCAVLAFFGLSLAGMAYGLSPGTCCARACAGAVIAYIGAKLGVKAINIILTRAMIVSLMTTPKELPRDEQSE
ncbi:hypothetical protein ACFL6U_15145 [Planctomycetota bacterium]